jgi:heptosyltransferase-1
MAERAGERTALVLHMLALGEAVFALPLLHALKHADPPWRTVCVARSDVAAILEASGLADEVILRDGASGLAGAWRLARRLRQARPAVSLGLATSTGNAVLAWLAGARRRIGYDYAHAPWLLHERVPFAGGGIENYLSLLPYVPAPRTVDSYVGLLRVPAQAQEQADRLLAEPGLTGRRFVALSPVSTGKLGVKAYPPEQWRAVCDQLRADGHPLVLVGSGADAESHAALLEGGTALEGGAGLAVSLAGRTPTLVLAGVLARAACVVGIDTGPIHVAAALGTPCVVLFGSSDPARTAPSGEGHTVLYRALDCQPCLAQPCTREGECLRGIAPEEIVEAVERTAG